jgi:hypothetical protein
MSYIVFCTFDLKNASAADYQNAYADLDAIGLKRVHVGGDGTKAVIPTTSAMGYFNGASAAAVRDDIRQRVKSAFQARRFKSEIFVVVGADGTWGATTT